ncbi:unnamed protein product, partial [Prorocentrum cordatum]
RAGEREAADAPDGDTSVDDDENLIRRLQGFCHRWSCSLPAWGELVNLIGEEPSQALKRLPAGIYGATTLLCMAQLRDMAAKGQPGADEPLLPPHGHLLPTKGAFWAAWLLPPAEEHGASAEVELLAALAPACRGPAEGVRRCACAACGAAGPAGAYEFVSRRDCEWVFRATVLPEEQEPRADAATPAVGAEGDGPRHILVAPPHFVCQLPGEPPA